MVKHISLSICFIGLLLTGCGTPSAGQLYDESCCTGCATQYEGCPNDNFLNPPLNMSPSQYCLEQLTTCSSSCGCTVTVEG